MYEIRFTGAAEKYFKINRCVFLFGQNRSRCLLCQSYKSEAGRVRYGT